MFRARTVVGLSLAAAVFGAAVFVVSDTGGDRAADGAVAEAAPERPTPDRRGGSPSADDRAAPSASEAARPGEPESSRSRRPTAAQREHHALMRARIERALRLREEAKAEPPPEAPAAPATATSPLPAGALPKEYIRQAVRDDLVPLARECYGNMLELDPKYSGRMVIEFDIMGDEDVGGIVDAVAMAPDNELTDPQFVECMSESLMTVEFEPPTAGGVVHVTYPMIFEPAPPGAPAPPA